MFYVYVYRDPRPEKAMQPVYVGKGCGQRSTKHWLKGNTGNKQFNDWLTMLRRTKLAPVIQVIAEFDNERDAFLKEVELIALYGRRDLKTGTLFNLTTGGEGFSGIVRTEEWEANRVAVMRASEYRLASAERSRKRWADPEYHKAHAAAFIAATSTPEAVARREAAKLISHRAPEFREKMKAVGRDNWDDSGYRERTLSAMKAAQSTPEEMARKAAATKAGWDDAVTREKRIEGIKASRTPELRAQIGASCKALWTDEKKAEQSAKMKKVLASPEAKAARSAAMKARWADPAKRAALKAAQNKASPS